MGTVFTSREIIQRLESEGWFLAKVKGDHHQYKHPIKPGKVTVQHPKKDLWGDVLASIFKQAGWK